MAKGKQPRKPLLITEEIEIWMDNVPNYIMKIPGETEERYCGDIGYIPQMMAKMMLDYKLGKSKTYKDVKELGEEIINILVPIIKWWEDIVHKLGFDLVLREKRNG